MGKISRLLNQDLGDIQIYVCLHEPGYRCLGKILVPVHSTRPLLKLGCLWGITPQSFTWMYCQVSNISRSLVGNKIVDHSDVVGASPVGTAPTTSSFSTYHLASMDWAKATARQDERHFSLGIVCLLYWRFYGNFLSQSPWKSLVHGPRPGKHVGPVVNLLFIIMFKIRKIKPNSGSVRQKPKSCHCACYSWPMCLFLAYMQLL